MTFVNFPSFIADLSTCLLKSTSSCLSYKLTGFLKTCKKLQALPFGQRLRKFSPRKIMKKLQKCYYIYKEVFKMTFCFDWYEKCFKTSAK